MPDPNAQPVLPNVGADPSAAPPPAAGAPPPVVASPPKAAATRQPAGKQKGRGKPQRRDIVEIPTQAFKARVQREAAVEIKRRLGITLEEAEAMVKAGGVAPAGAGKSAAQNTADQVVAQLRAENERLRGKIKQSDKEKEELRKSTEKKIRRAEDRATEARLMAEARLAGITNPRYIKAAIDIYAEALNSGETAEPSVFFGQLKETDPAFFAAPSAAAAPPAAPPPPVVAATTVPPESAAAGEVRPSPGSNGAGMPKNAESMSDQEFASHQRTYGFSPGMS
jgi:hypothetical protein